MIEKISLRDQVREYLIESILSGKITPGDPISLAEIARQIEVSVTPIREALNQLQRNNLIQAITNRGFILAPLSLEEAMEIYPIISNLESMAVKNATYSKKDIDQIKKANQKFAGAKSTRDSVVRDNDFHMALVSPYQNQYLKRILSDLKVRLILYEVEFLNDPELTVQSVAQHEEIIALLKKGEKESASDALVCNWEESMIFLQKNFNR